VGGRGGGGRGGWGGDIWDVSERSATQGGGEEKKKIDQNSTGVEKVAGKFENTMWKANWMPSTR